MRLTARVAILIAIAALVTAAVLPFRKVVSRSNSAQKTLSPLERRLQDIRQESSSRALTSTPLKTQPLRVPTVATGSPTEAGSEGPEMPLRYHRTFSPVGALLNPADDPNEADDALSNQPKLPDVNTKRARSLTHKISDGDTLAAIAQKYLGDAKRWREVFELNRDVLKNPDLLPIGTIIKIPPIDERASPRSQAEPSPGMVPIPQGAFEREGGVSAISPSKL
jgi:nucleoid-associated protein YgaU